MVYLKAREQYDNDYDHIVVEWCRDLEYSLMGNSNAYTLYIKRVKYAERRQKCIAEWMGRDAEKDEFEKKSPTPDCRCHKCNTSMNLWSKFLENWRGKEKYRMLFFYECSYCKNKRGIYDDGEEEDMTVKCDKCGSQNVVNSSKQKKNWEIQFREVCHDCDHIKKYTFNTPRKEKMDPNYERDRKRFCMSQDELNQLKFFVTNAETVFVKREERLSKSELITETKKAPTVFHSEPFDSRYFDRI